MLPELMVNLTTCPCLKSLSILTDDKEGAKADRILESLQPIRNHQEYSTKEPRKKFYLLARLS